MRLGSAQQIGAEDLAVPEPVATRARAALGAGAGSAPRPGSAWGPPVVIPCSDLTRDPCADGWPKAWLQTPA